MRQPELPLCVQDAGDNGVDLLGIHRPTERAGNELGKRAADRLLVRTVALFEPQGEMRFRWPLLNGAFDFKGAQENLRRGLDALAGDDLKDLLMDCKFHADYDIVAKPQCQTKRKVLPAWIRP